MAGKPVRIDTTPPEAADWPLVRLRTAGGVVLRRGHVLLIRRTVERQPQTRLPKGTIERGETLEQAALREVREETGLRAPRIVAPLGAVENHFAYDGRRYRRVETWFLMESDEESGDPPEVTDEWAWQLDWRRVEDAMAALTFPAERLAFRRALDHGATEVRWAPKLPRHLIRRLYERDAMGIVDDELIDEVGYGLLARCRSILTATDAHHGRIACPRCGATITRGANLTGKDADRDLVIACAACGWATTWVAYHRTYKGKQIFGANAVTAFRVYVEEFDRAHTPRARMLAIDRLLHAFHQQLRPSGRVLGRPAAANLLEGDYRETLAFLDEMTYGAGYAHGTPELAATRAAWAQNRAAYDAQRAAHQERVAQRRTARETGSGPD